MSSERVVGTVATVLILAYVGSYLALSDPAQYGESRRGGFTIWVEPHYRVGGETAAAVFRPIEHIDRRARPSFWATRHGSVKLNLSAAALEDHFDGP
jgi:hypothetical protein